MSDIKERVAHLNMTPIDSDLDEIALSLIEGLAIGVLLEPGDMTRYSILLAPGWSPDFGKLFMGIGDGSQYLILGYKTGLHPFSRHSEPDYIYEKLNLTNWHTAYVLHRLLTLVFTKLDEIE